MSWYDLDEVLSKAEVPDVARQLGMVVEKRASNLVTKCPFHADTRPSLVLYPSTGQSPSHYHCFSCDAHGYAVNLVKQVHGVEFKPAIEWIARNFGIAPKTGASTRRDAEESTRDDALTFAGKVFDRYHDDAAFVGWCQVRGFERDFLYGQGLRCLPAGLLLVRALQSESFGRQQALIDGLLSAGLLSRLRPKAKDGAQELLNLSEQFRDYFYDGRVLIPIRSAKNELVGFAGRYRTPLVGTVTADSEPPKYLLTPGFRKAETLFNAYQASQLLRTTEKSKKSNTDLYVVEGFLDALRLQSLKIPAVAVMGSSLSEAQKAGVVALAESSTLPAGSHLRLRLFFDRDAAGFEGAARASRQLLGLLGVAVEWIGFSEDAGVPSGKDPDEILRGLLRGDALDSLNRLSTPAIATLIVTGLGFKDATPLSDDRWNSISSYTRERALFQAVRTVRALSGASANWAQRLESLPSPQPKWIEALVGLLDPEQQSPLGATRPAPRELTFLQQRETRLQHARMLAEFGARRGELPCDEETWRALDRNAQLFNAIALDRLKQPAWHQVAPCDAVHLPRKLTGDAKVLNDPRRKVMPHPADLHLQQFLMNELLTERHDFSHSGPRTFSDCIPAVRWFSTEREVRITGYTDPGELSPALATSAIDVKDEPILSFAYQIDMEVLEGRRKPSDQGMFRPYIDCWRDFMGSLERQAKAIGPYVHVLRLDAKRYYDSIQRYVVRDRLLEPIEHALNVTGPEELSSLLDLPATSTAKDAAKRTVDLLCGGVFNHTYQHPDDGMSRDSEQVIGIPQGPVISAWIGTIAMFPVDAAARAFMSHSDQRHPDDPSRSRVGYARYVDDIVLMANSEARLHALREAVQAAAARLEITLVRKGDQVVPGRPESIMHQLNGGRVLAASVPAWEPPMVGDGETGWGIGTDEIGAMDRQSALHLLRHPSLLEDPGSVHDKVRDAMRAPDLRASDLGKCARALWWQIAIQSTADLEEKGKEAWPSVWQAFRDRWNEVSAGHSWQQAFRRHGYDILFAVEGLDMLMDSSLPIEKRRTQEWIDKHRKALSGLARSFLLTEYPLLGVTLTHNRSHIQRRLLKVQWKALQRLTAENIGPYADPQVANDATLTAWLCHAAISLRRFHLKFGVGGSGPLEALPDPSDFQGHQGPVDIQAACRYLKFGTKGSQAPSAAPVAGAVEIALPFLVANTTEQCRWEVLSRYPHSLAKNLPDGTKLKVLPPLPVEGTGMLAFTESDGADGIRLLAFSHSANALPPTRVPCATQSNSLVVSDVPLALAWEEQTEIASGLFRWNGQDRMLGLAFDKIKPRNRARFAAELYEVLRAIQKQPAGDGKEWVTIMAHVAHDRAAGDVSEVEGRKWYLVSEPVPISNLGVIAWVRDGRGGLRSISVPGGEYASLWRLGCTISDALGMASDIPQEPATSEDGEGDLQDPNQIEEYVLRQQLTKLRGTWISEAQVVDSSPDGLPKTIRRSLEILRSFDPTLTLEQQVRLVFQAEAETRSMAMRLERSGPGDLRDHLHQLPISVLLRLPLNVLECLPLNHQALGTNLRLDLRLMLAVAACIKGPPIFAAAPGIDKSSAPSAAEALHIGGALASAGVAIRGLVASACGIDRQHRISTLPERLPIPAGWTQPEVGRRDPQVLYRGMCKALSEDDWSGLNIASPWEWMLALLGILDGLQPQVLEAGAKNPLHTVYEHLRIWESAPAEGAANRKWAWPYDGMPAYDAQSWIDLVAALPAAASHVDERLGWIVRNVEASAFRRHRDDQGFTDAESQRWIMAKVQYTGLGSSDSVASVQVGSRRQPTWTEVRRRVNDDLLSVHTLDHKLGRWLLGIHGPVENVVEQRPATTTQVVPENPAAPVAAPPNADRGKATWESHSVNPDDVVPPYFRDSQRASWRDRGKLKSAAHMRVAFLQWFIDQSYTHPISEVGLRGFGLQERDLAVVRKFLVPKGAMAEADKVAVRGKEHGWPKSESIAVPSWPEHRRRCFLKSALDACSDLRVELLVVPELSVRRETVAWLEEQLQAHYPGLAVLAGTYRHFGAGVTDRDQSAASDTIHQLMAPMTLLWRPDEDLSKTLFAESRNQKNILRFWRGKKYRAVAASELFRPHWKTLQPLFRINPLLDQLIGDRSLSPEQQIALIQVIAEKLPPLRYCMELICSELFLLTSPANIEPLREEIAAMLRHFPTHDSSAAEEIVREDHRAVGGAMSVRQDNSVPRRTVLLVPAATTRSNDYWHAGQASVLASGTATVFCNAANPRVSCGGSCFIGITSTSKPHPTIPGMIETMTPYHGWQKGILTGRTSGALSEEDQALVIADIDPVHVVTGKPRPQLLPEPLSLVAYLPIVELLDRETNSIGLHQFLSNPEAGQINPVAGAEEVQTALASVASPPCSETASPGDFWQRFNAMKESEILDGSKLDEFAAIFRDPKSIRERLLAWSTDRHHQPHSGHGPYNLAPAWLDFLTVDLTLKEDHKLPEISVPPWTFTPEE